MQFQDSPFPSRSLPHWIDHAEVGDSALTYSACRSVRVLAYKCPRGRCLHTKWRMFPREEEALLLLSLWHDKKRSFQYLSPSVNLNCSGGCEKMKRTLIHFQTRFWIPKKRRSRCPPGLAQDIWMVTDRIPLATKTQAEDISCGRGKTRNVAESSGLPLLPRMVMKYLQDKIKCLWCQTSWRGERTKISDLTFQSLFMSQIYPANHLVSPSFILRLLKGFLSS